MPKSDRGHGLITNLCRFIRFNTVTTRGNLPFARALGRMLRLSGFRVSYQIVKAGRERFANVVGMKGGRGRPFLLASHLDTVPPGERRLWSRVAGNPWRARRRGRAVVGLGAADAKGPLLAMIQAAAGFKSRKWVRPLAVLGTYGEENGMRGAIAFTRRWRGPKPCAALVGEPSGLAVTYRHKGLGVLVIELAADRKVSLPRGAKKITVHFRGRQGHSSRPALGENALEKAVSYLKERSLRARPFQVLALEGGVAANLIPGYARVTLAEIRARAAETGRRGRLAPWFPFDAVLVCREEVQRIVGRLARRRDASFDPPTITSNWGIARSKGRTTALTFDFRLLPGQSVHRIARELARRLKKRLGQGGLRWRIHIDRANAPLGLDRDHPLPKLARRLVRSRGLSGRLETKPSCTEAGTYAAWGVPSVVLGPGRAAGNIHAPNERVELEEIEKAVRVYRAAIEAVCVRGEKCF